MSYSEEWDSIYKNEKQLSVWPWSDMVSLSYHFGNLHKGMRVLELGCGAGANIPFFVALESDYYAIEGSTTMVELLQKKFPSDKVHILKGDFTSKIPWTDYFDLIIDRSSLTHNSTHDIIRCISLIKNALKIGGVYIAVDWFSTKYDDYYNMKAQKVDDYTRLFSEGYFSDVGKVHFSDLEHIKGLFVGFSILHLTEKVHTRYIPFSMKQAWWDFVMKKEK